MHRPCFLSLAAVLLLVRPAFAAPTFGYSVVATYPHRSTSFTEGFLYRDGRLYESTGLSGHSSVLVEELETGALLQQSDLPAQYFGEGIVDWGPNLYQWTWQSHICFVLDRFSLKPVSHFAYTGEGWGMTRTRTRIITSDGTATLRFRDPANFRDLRHIEVREGSTPIQQLNELEYIHGVIYANIWHSDRIARISPRTGQVLSWIDLSGLLPAEPQLDAEAVLNGIAYDEKHDRLFVTGKRWPSVFQIQVDQQPRSPRR